MNILDALSKKRFISGQEIARSLNISRAAVHKQINKLRTQGYEIVGEKRKGYSLVSRVDLLLPGEIAFYRSSARSSAAIHCLHFETIASTQSTAKDLAQAGSPEGTLVIAERQSASYGRLRREWVSPRGGIWFSLILTPVFQPEKVPQLNLVLSMAISRSLERLGGGITPAIKWPNDILLNGKKAAGILVEMSAEVGKLNWAVAGVGVNANNAIPPALRDEAVSLAELLGQPVNRPQLVAAILEDIGELYALFTRRGFAPLAEEYNRRCTITGRHVRVRQGREVLDGTVEKIDNEGCLWLRQDGGRLQKIIAGDVTTKGELQAAAG
jgi:BirA family biotin operon repressor/biotin-[acetyl-CoA-carboxylase] ligase